MTSERLTTDGRGRARGGPGHARGARGRARGGPGHSLRWLLACWGANLRSALEYRASFVAQVLFMAANNFLFLAFWAVFFERFESVSGWRLRDVALLYGVCATSFGLTIVLFGGVLDLARRVPEGRLDSMLLRARPVFLQAATSRMQVSGLGDVASGLLLLVLSGNAVPARLAPFVAMTLASTVAFVAFCTLVASLAFRVSRADTIAGQAIHGLLMFSLYPPSLFAGWAKALLFVVLPAGLVGWMPAGLVMRWSWPQAAALVAGIGLLVGAAWLAWTSGLARYESGNLTQAVDT